jgi:peptidoglycan hydrolase-like protein with peptidoglycan-binding domain
MHTVMAVFMFSVLWLAPMTIEAGTTGEQPPEQKQTISKDDFKLIQERLRAEGVYAGPVDGEVNAQTGAALRAYQQKQGLPVSGAADEAILRELQIHIPPAHRGSGDAVRQQGQRRGGGMSSRDNDQEPRHMPGLLGG